MELIPVIDLLQGQAVLAHQGLRKHYRPLCSPLCPSSDPLEVIAAYLKLHPFRTLYIADIDAIEKKGDNGIIINRIRQRFPDLILWIDCGWPPVNNQPWQIPVIGSESLSEDWRRNLPGLDTSWILSLDFDAHGFRGPKSLLERSDVWPQEVILMCLNRVGSGHGPDWHHLNHYLRHHPEKDWIASGGIRHQQDLHDLENMGIRRALSASALHQGTVTPETNKSRHLKGSGFHP